MSVHKPLSTYDRSMQVAVCGPSQCTDEEAKAAFEVGRQLVRRGATVLCGGGSGVMAAVAAGVRSLDGLVVGVLPGPAADRTNLSIVIDTGMGEARNAVLVRSADAVIVIGGSPGTLSEVGLALRRGSIPVVSLYGWRVLDQHGRPVPGIQEAADAGHAVAIALSPADNGG
jgi:uncharacterized protein (TIGR00725 family)